VADAVTLVANLRHTTEHRVVNDYTYRQIERVVGTHIKDKFMVVSAIMGEVENKDRGNEPGGGADGERKGGRKPRRLPAWYNPKYRPGVRVKRNVVDLDGPMARLAPYVGHGAINRVSRRELLARKKRRKKSG